MFIVFFLFFLIITGILCPFCECGNVNNNSNNKRNTINTYDVYHPNTYCKYLQNNPEPAILVYNRMPKTGSSTVDTIFETEVKKTNSWFNLYNNKNSMHLLSLNNTYWSTYYNHTKDVEHLVKRFHPRSKYRIVAGHFGFPSVEPGSWGVKRIEYINTARVCVDREKSELFYSLLDSKKARERIRKGQQQSYLDRVGIGDPIACFHNETCTVNTLNKFRTGTMNTFYCGNCVERFGYVNATIGSIDRLFNPNAYGGGFVSIGIMSHMKESFELFKCALPSFFRDTVSEMTKVVENRGTVSNKTFPLLDIHLRDMCSQDDLIHDALQERFWSTLAHIRKHPECCRKRKY